MSTWLQHPLELSDRDLMTIVRLVYERSGISLHEGKRALVATRLQKRLKQRGFDNFRDYVQFLKADASGDEITALLDAIATNHTSFFREPQHFDFLNDVVLPSLRSRSDTVPILGWSAACATGEEAYTLAMTAIQRFGDEAATRVRLLASDLSTKAIAHARAGVYKQERVADVPRHVVLRYFTKHSPGHVQAGEAIRRLIEFRRLNLISPLPPGPSFDFIFCRNVMIYFDREIQQRVVTGLEERLARGGYLFVSHSESLNNLRHGLTWIAPAVYRREGR